MKGCSANIVHKEVHLLTKRAIPSRQCSYKQHIGKTVHVTCYSSDCLARKKTKKTLFVFLQTQL